MRPPRLLAIVLLLASVPARAAEVRQGTPPARLHGALARAYAPCLAPNAVTANGEPACAPAVTSACDFNPLAATVDVVSSTNRDAGFTVPRLIVSFQVRPGGPPECQTGTYRTLVGLRATGSPSPDQACASGTCTFEDVVVETTVSQALLTLPDLGLTDPSFEITSVTIVAPDGLPIAATGVEGTTATLTGNLTVPYPPCTTPEPAGRGDSCSIAPWQPSCDYDEGSLTWATDSAGGPTLTTTLTGVAGTSPLCATGDYEVHAVARVTLNACGPNHTDRCTLPDRIVTVRAPAHGRDVETTATVPLGVPGTHPSVQVLAMRVVDPTGSAIGTMGVTGVVPLGGPRIAIGPRTLKLRVVLPVEPGVTIDPTADPTTIALTDRDGTVFSVTIPPERWQLQPPLGSRWDYKDKLGTIAGVRKIVVKRVVDDDVVTGYRIDLAAKDVDLAAADFPSVTVHVTAPAADAGPPLHAERNRTCRVKKTKLDCK